MDMRLRLSLVSAMIAAGVLATPAWADSFFFTTGNADKALGALSQSQTPGQVETETADDFILTQTTVINGATITGLVRRTDVADILNVEVEVYHRFPEDPQDTVPPSGQVPSRTNSPSDNGIDTATRDASNGTLSFFYTSLNPNFTVSNSVVNGINPFIVNGKTDANRTGGEGPTSGEEVQISITFTKPIVLPAGHYFFRPEVLVTGGDFLYLSAPRPLVSPTPITPDLQAWIRNARLAPDWLRIGTDIIDAANAPGPTFNMTFSLGGNSIPEAGIPGEPSCHGQTVAALATQFGGIKPAASTLGFSSVAALQDSFKEFCNP
jgi:hypothetical protein